MRIDDMANHNIYLSHNTSYVLCEQSTTPVCIALSQCAANQHNDVYTPTLLLQTMLIHTQNKTTYTDAIKFRHIARFIIPAQTAR